MISVKAIFVLMAGLASINASPDKSKWLPLVCGPKGILQPSPGIHGKIEACGKGNCYFKCHTEEIGLANDDGTVSLQHYFDYVDATVPEQHKETSKAFMQDCYTKFGRFIQPSDTSCDTSKRFGDCLWKLQRLLTC